MTPEQIHKHITPLILRRLDADHNRRGEALHDFLAISLPGMDESSIDTVAAMVPELPESMYRKWIGMFVDRLIETIPQNQLDELCNGSEDNNATLALVYLMFMESARMEKQVAEDLAALGNTGASKDDGTPAPAADAQADALALYLKARLQQKSENK
ncbi:hypothetical protein LJC48_03480 [Desulfovibrio sp. OttesenSCG-928-C06]|nr:hypothetical protein [Desulfovibrio sp. OttesenSCG-928-C06]